MDGQLQPKSHKSVGAPCVMLLPRALDVGRFETLVLLVEALVRDTKKEKKCLIPVSCKTVVSLQSSGVICFQLTHLRIMLFDILLFVIIVLISFSITLLLFFHSVYKNRKNIYPLFTKYLCFHNGRNKSCNTEGHLTFRNTCTTSHSDLQVKA